MRVFRELGDRQGTAPVLNCLGWVALSLEEYAVGRDLLELSLAMSRELGDRWYVARALLGLGLFACIHGDSATARSRYEECLKMFLEMGDKWFVAASLEGMVGIAAAEGQPARGAKLAGAAEAIRETIGAPMNAYSEIGMRRYLAAIHASLNGEAFEQARREGKSMLPEEFLATEDNDSRQSEVQTTTPN